MLGGVSPSGRRLTALCMRSEGLLVGSRLLSRYRWPPCQSECGIKRRSSDRLRAKEAGLVGNGVRIFRWSSGVGVLWMFSSGKASVRVTSAAKVFLSESRPFMPRVSTMTAITDCHQSNDEDPSSARLRGNNSNDFAGVPCQMRHLRNHAPLLFHPDKKRIMILYPASD